MAVPVKIGASFEAGSPQALFEGIDPSPNPREFVYQPTADGKRFLVIAPARGDTPAATPLTVVLNWQEGLKK